MFINKLSNKLNIVIRNFSIFLVLLILIVSFIQVVSRYVFDSSIPWSEEMVRYCFIWTTLLGSTVLVRSGGHAIVDLYSHKLRKKTKIIHSIFINILIAYVAGVLIIEGFKLSENAMVQNSPALNLSMGLVYSVVPITGIITELHVFSNIIDNIKSLKVSE